jgi:putative hydrolase of the HAD superfamily
MAGALMDAWLSSPFTLDTRWLETLRAYFPEALVVVVTNATTALAASLQTSQFNDYVDSIINSSAIGVAKPDVAFYTYALTQQNVAAQNALFIDDSAQNCEVAASLGFHKLHFTTKADALTLLTQYKSQFN